MKRAVFCAFALYAAGAAAPAFAGKVYVPITDRNTQGGGSHRTEVRIANRDPGQERRYTRAFLPAGANGTQTREKVAQTLVLSGRTTRLVDLSTPGRFGLLEIDTAPQIQVEARMINAPASGPPSGTPVPVISSTNALPPGALTTLLGLSRNTAGGFTDLGVVNLARETAQCTVTFSRANGTGIGTTAAVSLPPLSLRNFGDALGLLGESQAVDARAEVSCDKTFFAFAAVFDAATSQFSFLSPAASGSSTLGTGGGTTPPPPQGEAIVFESRGLIHKPTPGNEFRVLPVPVAGALSLRRLVAEWDVIPGPWNPAKPSGNHNLGWVHRGKYRSNTIINLSAFGPTRNEVKNSQNLEMARQQVTTAQQALALQQGTLYHVRYVYDAENQSVTVTVSSDGQTLATLQHPATAGNRTLTVPASGLVVQFGHTAAQAAGGIEYPSYDWEYRDLRIEMYAY
jgi:hypothetical protein